MQALIAQISTEAGPISASLRQSAERLDATLRQAQATLLSAQGMIGPESQLRYETSGMLKELAAAARSIRVFTDYLERNPEALIRGKGAPQR